MKQSRVGGIKHAQKESFLFRELSQLFIRLVQDEKELRDMVINRVKLSAEKSMCIVFFMCPGGKQAFDEKFHTLVLYKPSLRTALAKALHGPYVPNLLFEYDAAHEKQRRVDDLIDSLKDEGKL